MYKRKLKVSRYKSCSNKKVAIPREDQMPVLHNTPFPATANNIGSGEESNSRTTKLKEVPSHMTSSELHHTHSLWNALVINNPMAYISALTE